MLNITPICGKQILVVDELARGALVQPFGPVLTGRRYFLVYPREAAGAPRIAAIRDWIGGEMRGPTTRAAPASPAARRAARRAGGRG